MCSYLEWRLNVEPNALKEFEEKVKRDFDGPGPYPSYLMPSPAPSPMPSTTPYASGALTPTPSFVTGRSVPSTSQPQSALLLQRLATSPPMPDTPEASHFPAASPVPSESAQPSTPQGQVDNEVRIASPEGLVVSRLTIAIIRSQCLCGCKRTPSPRQGCPKMPCLRRGNQNVICLRTRRRSPGKSHSFLTTSMILSSSLLSVGSSIHVGLCPSVHALTLA